MADGLPGAPLGSRNAAKGRLVEQALKRAVMADDGATLRRGVEKQLEKFADGDQQAANWVRDTLDGRPKQTVDFENEDNPLTSLQVLFVDAATRLANAQAERLEHRVIDAEQQVQCNIGKADEYSAK